MSEENDQSHHRRMLGVYHGAVPPYQMMPMPPQQVFPPAMPPNFGQPRPQQPPRPPQEEGQLPLEQSYVENILRLNRGRVATIYMTFENNDRWNAKIFKGVIEAAGRGQIIISDPETEKGSLLLQIYLDKSYL